MNKIYIPQIKDEIVVAQDWKIINNDETFLEIFGLKRISYDKPFEVTIPKGSVIRVLSIDANSRSIGSISLTLRKIGDKKIKLSDGRFSVELNDFNRLYIEESATQGMMNFTIDWNTQKLNKGESIHVKNKVGVHVGSGSVRDGNKNKIEVFSLVISELKTKEVKTSWHDWTEIEHIKIKLYEHLSSDRPVELVEYKSTMACAKFAKQWLNENNKYFLNSFQTQAIREEKFKRIIEEE